MKLDDFPKFRGLLSDVMAYYGKDVSKFTLDVWWGACEGFDYEQVEKAMQRHATDPEAGVFAPKVADVVRILSGTHTDRALLAWGKVLESMSSVGAYTDVIFDDAAIHAAIEDLGGWPKVCRSDTESLSYLQKRFCDSHKAYTGRGEFPYPRRLIGDRSTDAEYKAIGMKPPLALVGDQAACRQVFDGGLQGGKVQITTSTPSAAKQAALILEYHAC